jgi:hypothetical protein
MRTVILQPCLVDLFMAGTMPLDVFTARHDFADFNRAAAGATAGAAIKPGCCCRSDNGADHSPTPSGW